MGTSLNEMPKSIVKYVSDGTMIVNTILLLCHISFGILFYIYKAEVMFYYNCISIITYIFSYGILRRKKAWTYIIIVYVEIFVFMVLAVIYLGWEYGFQQYCIGFVASIIFTDFYVSHERIMSKRTITIVAFDVLIFIALRLWTYRYPYVYEVNNQMIVHMFYIINSLIGFAFLIMYSSIYSSTMYRLENALTDMANVDPLTGICNRRKMQQILKAALGEKGNRQHHTTIAMMDVDCFKNINDTYGHDVGDEVLVMLAEILRNRQEQNENFRVCRWGGEEFLVFYESYRKNRGEVIREFDELRRQIQDTKVSSEGNEIKITVTIGLAFYEEGTTVQSLIKEADNNLYAGKKGGKNCVVS